jgi:phospholipase/carboxylesterase
MDVVKLNCVVGAVKFFCFPEGVALEMETPHPFQGLHQGQPVLTAGDMLSQAHAAMILVHGRGADAEDILGVAYQLAHSGFAYLAPQAAGNTWYPNRFSFPLESNEPWLSSALAVLSELLTQIAAAGIPPERTMLLGFSQGASLSLEFTARNNRRYGGVAGLSGVLIGPDNTPRPAHGSLAGTPIFLGCSDVDPYVTPKQVDASAAVLRRLGGEVTEQLYPQMDHSINQAEIDFVRGMMAKLD